MTAVRSRLFRGTWKSIKRLWLDYAITYLATLGVLVTGVLTYRVASQNFGEDGLSQYASVRRVISFLQPVLALGTAVALSRKVAACKFESRGISESSYLLAGSIMILTSTLAFSVVLIISPDFFAYAFFGSADYRHYAMAMTPMLLGLCLHVVCFAQLHGRFSMRLANGVQFLSIGLIPLIMVAWQMSVVATFVWTGCALALVNVVGIGAQCRSIRSGVQGVFPAIAELARFGPARVPGDLAFAALMTLPATMVTHSCDMRRGGLVAFCITLLALAQATTTPISTILLPQATNLLRGGRTQELRSNIIVLLIAALGLTALLILFVLVYCDFVLRICLGQYAAELPGLAQIIILGALPLNCHTCLRSIVDVGRDQAVNARSCCLALASYFLAWFAAKFAVADLYAAPIALVIALFCLAGLSSWEVWRILKPTSEWADWDTHSVRREAA